MPRPPHTNDIAQLQKQLQQLHARSGIQPQKQQEQQQQQECRLSGDTSSSALSSGHATDSSSDQRPLEQDSRQGHPTMRAAPNSPAPKSPADLSKLEAQQQQQQQRLLQLAQQTQQRRSSSPLTHRHPVGGKGPKASHSAGRSPSPGIAGSSPNLQDTGLLSQGLGLSHQPASSGAAGLVLDDGRSPTVHSRASPPLHTYTLTDSSWLASGAHPRASLALPLGLSAAERQTSPSPQPRASYSPAAGLSADHSKAFPVSTLAPAVTATSSGGQRAALPSHLRASPPVQHRASPPFAAGSLIAQERPLSATNDAPARFEPVFHPRAVSHEVKYLWSAVALPLVLADGLL